MSFKQLATERFSVRSYKTNPVEREKIDLILEAARIAPTARNAQPQRIKVLQGADDLAKVDGFTPCRFGAPLVFLICYDKNVSAPAPLFETGTTGQVDASIVTAHMMFQAQDLGLGSLWVQRFDPAKASELLSLPANIVPMAVLDIGYAADDAKPSDMHGKRGETADFLL